MNSTAPAAPHSHRTILIISARTWSEPTLPGGGADALALLPHAAVVVLWAILRRSWNYGVRNMGLYIDPLGDPERFAAALTRRPCTSGNCRSPSE
jgi:hypothetical protein